MFNRIKELVEKELEGYEKKCEDNSKKEEMISFEMSKSAKIMKSFLDCDCKYYPRNTEDNDIICGYVDSLNRAKEGKFIPIIVDISENLLDTVIMNTVIDSDDDSESILDWSLNDKSKKEEFFRNGVIDLDSADTIEKYRKNMISKDFSFGKELLDEMIENNREYIGGYELERDELEIDDESFVDMNDFEVDDNDKKHGEVLIAEIPVKNPWEVFAYIPFGGWNDCPGNEEIMNISKYWYEKYGAIPMRISSNSLGYIVEKNVEDRIRFAEEFYAFCPDYVDKYMEEFNIEKLAKKIYRNKLWYFCWN